MKDKVDILLVGQTPPPYHGQAVVTQMLFEHDWDQLTVERLRMSYSDSLDDVGRAGLHKIIHLVQLVWKTWLIVFHKRPQILYYLPASANKNPVIRDIIYLSAVRWLFPQTVFHYHAGGLPSYLDSCGLLGRLAKWCYRHSDVSIELCPTDDSPGEKFHAKSKVIIPNGLEVARVHRDRSSEKFRALFIGGLHPGKGILELIETAKLVKGKGEDIEFRVVGPWSDFEFKKHVEGLIDSYGLQDYVFFVGSRDGDDKWLEYANADCFFFPSHYEAENFPLVLIEAMGCGLPVISTNWRGIPILVGDCTGAELYDVKSPDQYAQALITVAHDRAKLGQMGASSEEYYQQKYTRDKFIARMAKVFKKTLLRG